MMPEFWRTGEVAQLGEMQREENRIRSTMSPQERSERSLAQLREMAEIEPGLRYLFTDTERGRG
jgi:hypothetical protein